MMFLIFLLKTLVLTSTHYLCFGSNIRKIGTPLYTPVLTHKSGGSRVYTCHGHVILLIFCHSALLESVEVNR